MKIETLGDAWRVLESHGLEGKYCFHCDQFAQARVLQKQDEIISDTYEALKRVPQLYAEYCALRPDMSAPEREFVQSIIKQVDEALAKAK